ncbi:MAG: hypothetical protein P5702_24300, partial [Limnospira sp. PMC 1291.21]|uniref:hypothetical protein n=1 Tax=Limnospira sp. PMC 1291.21 TaxID=2981074 RepID=UPI0028E16ECE
MIRDGQLALEAGGELFLTGGGFAGIQASRVLFGYNETGLALSGETLQVAGLSYSFVDLPPSTDYLAVSVLV